MGGSQSHEMTENDKAHPDNVKMTSQGWTSLKDKKRRYN